MRITRQGVKTVARITAQFTVASCMSALVKINVPTTTTFQSLTVGIGSTVFGSMIGHHAGQYAADQVDVFANFWENAEAQTK